jgi:hypothetical protein
MRIGALLRGARTRWAADGAASKTPTDTQAMRPDCPDMLATF